MVEIGDIRNEDHRLIGKRYLIEGGSEQMIGIIEKGCFTGIIWPTDVEVKIVNMRCSDIPTEAENRRAHPLLAVPSNTK